MLSPSFSEDSTVLVSVVSGASSFSTCAVSLSGCSAGASGEAAGSVAGASGAGVSGTDDGSTGNSDSVSAAGSGAATVELSGTVVSTTEDS